jgi:ABC-2 type transport system permease protein
VNARPLWQLTLARLRELGREPGTLFWAFGFPVLLSIGLGLAFRKAPADGPLVGVVEPAPAGLVDSLTAAGVRVARLPPLRARDDLRTGRVALVVASQTNTSGSSLKYWFDPARPDARGVRETVDGILQRAAGRRDPIGVTDEVVTEPGARYIDFLVPGLIGMNVMSGSMWAVGFALVNLRVRKLLKRLLATPLRRWQLLASLMLARLILLPVEVATLLVVSRLAFGVPVNGSLAVLAVVAIIGCLSFSGVALCVASRAQSLETMTGLINAVLIPMFVLSGVFFPSSRFPDALQPVISWLPLTALNDALRGVILDGTPLRALGRSTLILACWGTAGYALGLRRFRWT